MLHDIKILTYICLIGGSLLAALYLRKLDQKRISSPCYRADLIKKRQAAKLAKTNELKSRKSTFPEPHDTKEISKFVICKLKRAEHFMETNCRKLAVENISDALYMLSDNEAKRILDLIKCTRSPRIYDQVCNEYIELKNT